MPFKYVRRIITSPSITSLNCLSVLEKYFYVSDFATNSIFKLDRNGVVLRQLNLTPFIALHWLVFVNTKYIFTIDYTAKDIYIFDLNLKLIRILDPTPVSAGRSLHYVDDKYLYFFDDAANTMTLLDFNGNLIRTVSLSETIDTAHGLVLNDKYLWLNPFFPYGFNQYSRDGTLIKFHATDTSYDTQTLASDGLLFYAIDQSANSIRVFKLV